MEMDGGGGRRGKLREWNCMRRRRRRRRTWRRGKKRRGRRRGGGVDGRTGGRVKGGIRE